MAPRGAGRMGETMTRPGKALILTGSTGAGKSTTCNLLIDRLDEPWLHFGIDLVLGKLVPRQFVDGGRCTGAGVHGAPDDPSDPNGPWHLDMGRYGLGFVRTFHRMAAAALRNGQDLVMDHITMLDPPILQDCVEVFAGLPVWFVALKPPAEVSPRRLEQRLDSIAETLGREHAMRNTEAKKKVAASLYASIHRNDVYDQVIDSEAHSPDEVTALILEQMGECRGSAFPELLDRLRSGRAPFS